MANSSQDIRKLETENLYQAKDLELVFWNAVRILGAPTIRVAKKSPLPTLRPSRP